MRTSLNNIESNEKFLTGTLEPQEAILFEARLLLDNELKSDVFAQRKVYELIRLNGRTRLTKELEELHTKIFTDPSRRSFREKIFHLFKRN